MAGLYQRTLTPNTASPAMQVAASQGAAGGIPRGASAAMPQQGQGIDAAQLGGLLGMIRNSAAPGATGEGVFNPGVMPGVGQSMALGGSSAAPAAANTAAQAAPSAGVLGAGIPTDGMGLNFDPSRLASILGGMNFGA